MSTSAARTYEQQNDASLDKLFDKVKALRGATTDIHSDVESQRAGLLADTSETFDAFASRLQSTSQRFTRNVVNASRGNRTMMLYIICGLVVFFLFYRLFF